MPLDSKESIAGSQYTSLAFTDALHDAGVAGSIGTVGDAYDNAMSKSSFATLEYELGDRRHFKNQIEARMAVFDFIERWDKPTPSAHVPRVPVPDELRSPGRS